MSTSPPAGKPKPTQKWVSRMGTAVRRSPSLLSRQSTDPEVTPAKAPAKPTTKDVPASPPPRPAKAATVVPAPAPAPAPAAVPEPTAAKPQSGNKLMAKLGAATRRNSSSVSLARVVDSDTASIMTTGSAESTASHSVKDQASGGSKWAAKLGAAAKRSPSTLSLARPTAASAAKNTDSDSTSLRKSTSRPSLLPAAKTTPSRPGTPVSTKTVKPASPPPPPLPADAKAKVAKTVKAPPSPPAIKTKATPAEAAAEKAKPKWTARVGGAVRRSSSLLSSTKPITAPTPTPAAKVEVTAPSTARGVPSAILVRQELAPESDAIAESPTETPEPIADQQLTAEPEETVFVDEPVALVEDVRADSPFENVPEASTESAPNVPVDSVSEEEESSALLAAIHTPAAVQVLDKVSVLSPVSEEEVPRSSSVTVLVDEPTALVDDVRADSPFENVPESAPNVPVEEEQPSAILAAIHTPAAVQVVPSPINEEEVPRSSSPFDDNVLNEVAPAVQEEVRSLSPFEDVALQSNEPEPRDESFPVVSAPSVSTRNEDVAERPKSPFDDEVAISPTKVEESVIARPKSPFEDVVLQSREDEVAETVSPVLMEYNQHAVETETLDVAATVAEKTKPTSAVLPDSHDIPAAKVEQVAASEHVVSSDSEEHDLTDEDPFADPPPAQPVATALKEKDESWTLVKSYHDDDLDIQVDGHLEVVLADNPWATTHVQRPVIAPLPTSEMATVQDEEVDITQPIIMHTDTRPLRAQSVPPTPSPPMLPSLAPRPKTPPLPPTATKSTITPTFGTLPAPSFSTITTPLRGLRASSLPPSAVSAQYHPLAQEEAEECAGYGTSASTSTSNSTLTGSARSRDESVARSTEGTDAAGSRPPSVPKKDPFADPYPPRQRAGASQHEEYTAWGSMYEMISNVIAELLTLSRWIVSRR